MEKPQSVIRSFVRREGRFTKGQKAAFKNYWPVYGIEVKDGQLDFQCIFDSTQSVVLDIGFGNGEALLALAMQHPHLNFLGVEVYRPGIGSLLRKLGEAKLSNVRVINIDVTELLHEHIKATSLASVLVWFPDPWPKKRHHKRRLIQPEFLKLVASRLVDKGELHIATDWQPYAMHIQEIVKQRNLFKKVSVSTLISQRPQTKFERRGKKLGHPIFSQAYKKIS